MRASGDRGRRGALLLVLALGRAGGALAQGPSPEEARRAPLVGLTGMRLVVEAPDAQAQKAGLTAETIRAAVEGRLRQGGIPLVDDPKGRLSPPGFPSLHVGVKVEPLKAGGPVYATSLNLRQAASLVRKPAIIVNASTWHTGSVGRGGPQLVLEALGRHCDEFVRDYQGANGGEHKK
ncbi:MAG TPA: hypothetical protein VN375_10185 [Vicinamibacteria bacterium]|jgi:hypothetical protein|nr:hypothetical protein [Vicinamibacteria bacterium]